MKVFNRVKITPNQPNILKTKERTMYYNSDKKSNDYYSAYKDEMSNTSQYQESEFLNKLVKLGVLTLVLALLAVAAFYFFNYFSVHRKDNILPITPSKIAQESHVQPVQQAPSDDKENFVKESMNTATQSSSINPKDIELIVKIIMSQMEKAPQEKVVTPTAKLEKQLVDAEETVRVKQTLKEGNHYNKVLVSSTEPISNELMQLQNRLNDVIEEKSEKNEGSNYAKAISEELYTRSNEMTIVVVQQGDTLSKIAKKIYGEGDDYVKIYNANPEIVKNPDQIYAGQRLRIPA